MWAYHGTDIDNLESIIIKGLEPRVPGDKIDWGTKPVVFYTLNPKEAAIYADLSGILLRFELPKDGKQPMRDSPYWVSSKKILSKKLEVFIGGIASKRASLEDLLNDKNWTNILNYKKF